MAVDQRTGHLFVARVGPLNQLGLPKGNGVVLVLDEHSGTILRTIPVGEGPFFVLIAERAKRVLVVNSGGGRVSVAIGNHKVRTRTVPGTVTVLDLSRL